mmetsp:Transcript_34875/g.89556  ORF Transcript_34875/g.89556 Transcript_34875/m.89556 type:complete len:708 (+) Transcript_34875:2-2125(+)
MDLPSSSAAAAEGTAEHVLCSLAPGSRCRVRARLQQEGIRTEADLACLDKDDLQHLGLSMLERGRVLAWARQRDQEVSLVAPPPSPSPAGSEGGTPAAERPTAELGFRGSPWCTRFWSSCEAHSVAEEQRLKSEDAEFWCNLVAAPHLGRCLTQVPTDVRENMLEELFDLTPERVAEVYHAVAFASGDRGGRVLEAELGKALQRFGLNNFDDKSLAQVFEELVIDRSVGLTLGEFIAILSRLKLAQLLLAGSGTASPDQSWNAEETPDQSWNAEEPQSCRSCPRRPLREAVSVVELHAPALRLIAVDYNASHHTRIDVDECHLRDFFFMNRQLTKLEAPLIRWVHVCEFDMTTLLALTVKYSLHPLGVEDVIEQCPSKIDRYGSHYFVAMEQLSLASPPNPKEPVRVAGYHLAVFCSGPPLFDTIITVSQPDKSFAGDWPGGAEENALQGDTLTERLRKRLAVQRSRLRERRADFLMYHAIDLTVDELFAVTRAYAARLHSLEHDMQEMSAAARRAEAKVHDPSREAALARMQLAVVIRRIRGLQRMVRQLVADRDLTAGLSRYLHDVADHLDEAYEDAVHLADRSMALITAHRRAVERCLEAIRQRSSDRLSMILFILTVGTFVFAPMQFLAGVYGMNFVHGQEPGIPELEWTNGYAFFWLAIGLYLVLLSVVSTICYCGVRRKTDSDKELQQSLDTQAALLPGLH